MTGGGQGEYHINMNDRSYLKTHKGHDHFVKSKIRELRDSLTLGEGDEELLKIVRNLCDETKLKIYVVLHHVTEMSVADLAEVVRSSQSVVSHALADLKDVGLVSSYRCGKLVCYRMADTKGKSTKLRVLQKFIA